MALNKQIQIYSVDTSAFYHAEEQKLHYRLILLYQLKKKYQDKAAKLQKKKLSKERKDVLAEEIQKKSSLFSKEIKRTKEQLQAEFKKNNGVRSLDEHHLKSKNIISVFDSTLIRTLKIPENSLSLDFMVVQTYFFEIIEDIILDGFFYQNERYVCLTASAGQIRTKKTMFIKESALSIHQFTLMCGLTVDRINTLGGVNINKYLAYLALCNSATDEWRDFDIRKSIVVDDMETTIHGLVDFIDDQTYSIERKQMDIPINHTDGCGMILSKKYSKSFMVRLPWIKGVLVPFPFDDFIKEKKCSGKIVDIYQQEHDILAEGIEVIFTKSQFKMHKFYQSWEDYKFKFTKYNCTAGICNEEEDHFAKAKMGYQMLQTLTDITDAELQALAQTTSSRIKNIGADRRTMLNVLGVTKSNTNKNYYQQALEIYPELLNDTYSKEILKQVKKSIVREGRAGKLDIHGAYTFIFPDLYAFCEYLFLHQHNPAGLLKDGEVYCCLYKDGEKLDCLRSPHLYREHAVRKNMIDETKAKWLITNGLYTSCHDIISKLLMFDVDGDKSLVCADQTLVRVAERNMKDVVPLYYNMAKSEAVQISNKSIFEGLRLAYTGGRIGPISNNIAKIWNSEHVDLTVIKLLCMENNFIIDYAKTLYKPTRPKDSNQRISAYTKQRLPHFFVYAKTKEEESVEQANQSAVNRLEKIIPNPTINFKAVGLNAFDYTLLLHHPDQKVAIDDHVVERYRALDLKKHFMFTHAEANESHQKILYQNQRIRAQILEVNPDLHYVTDVLVQYLYTQKKSSYKTTLWECFGDILIEHLKNNISTQTVYCASCGDIVDKTSNRKKYCDDCRREKERESWRENKKKQRHVQVLKAHA